MKMWDCIIVGAGISGLVTAQLLKRCGWDVVVLEAQSIPGGRIQPVSTGVEKIDGGATWIHGIHANPLTLLARHLRLPLIHSIHTRALLFDNEHGVVGLRPHHDAVQTYRLFMQWLHTREDDMVGHSLWDVMIRSNHPVQQFVQLAWFQEWWRDSIRIIYAQEPERLDVSSFDDDIGFEGPDVLISGGFYQFIEIFTQGLSILYEQPVHACIQEGGIVQFETPRGSYRARTGVLTIPVEVWKRGVIEFHPHLPEEKRLALASIEPALMEWVILTFPEIFWQEDIHFFRFNHSLVPLWMNYNVSTGKPILAGLTGGNHVQEILTKAREDLIKDVLEKFRQVWHNVPDPVSVFISNWAENPWVRCAFTSLPPGVSSVVHDILARPFKQLYFAGEATERRFRGTVHGAIFSALRVVYELTGQKPKLLDLMRQLYPETNQKRTS